MVKEVDLKEEISYWKKQCKALNEDVRILRRELHTNDFLSEDKYNQFKEWVITNHSDVWVVKGIFDAFEKEYNNYLGEGVSEKKRYRKVLGLIEDKGNTFDLGETVDLLNNKEDEIQRLKAQLEHGEDVCSICKHTYLTPTGDKYYIAQCRKNHNECPKGTVNYCEDFEIKEKSKDQGVDL